MARYLNGVVTSDKADKTIVVTARTRKTHPLYKKQYTINTKFIAHDEKNEAKVGDKVVLIETRPLSARKHFKLDHILERGSARFQETDATADIPQEEKTEAPSPRPKSRKSQESAPESKEAM